MDIAPLNVLCIEDTVADFLLIERTLRHAGLAGRCERVEGSEALTAALAEKQWDVVLSDYALPGMYFTDTPRRFLHHPPNLPLVPTSRPVRHVTPLTAVALTTWL